MGDDAQDYEVILKRLTKLEKVGGRFVITRGLIDKKKCLASAASGQE